MDKEDKTWVIINLESVFFDRNCQETHIIPERTRPTVIYTSKTKAQKELLRLQQKHSAESFVLFEAVQFAVPNYPGCYELVIDDI